MKKNNFLIIFFIFCLTATAQNKYWVSFRNKSGTEFNPYRYFDPRTIQQRLKMNIPLNDSSDFPVNTNYITRVVALCDSISFSSRWLNGVAVYTSQDKEKIIAELPFVKNVVEMQDELRVASNDDAKITLGESTLLLYQTDRMQGKIFQKESLDGKGIRIAVFDVGFPGVDKSPVFKHLRDNKSIVATYDFIRKKENVYSGHWHGTATLSCIAGRNDSINIGLATGAEFLLARTEKTLTETVELDQGCSSSI